MSFEEKLGIKNKNDFFFFFLCFSDILFIILLMLFHKPIYLEMEINNTAQLILNEKISFDFSSPYEKYNVLLVKETTNANQFYLKEGQTMANANIFYILAFLFFTLSAMFLGAILLSNNFLSLFVLLISLSIFNVYTWNLIVKEDLTDKTIFYNFYYGKGIFFEKVKCKFQNLKIVCDAKFKEEFNNRTLSLNERIALEEMRKDILALSTKEWQTCKLEKINIYPFVEMKCENLKKPNIWEET